MYLRIGKLPPLKLISSLNNKFFEATGLPLLLSAAQNPLELERDNEARLQLQQFYPYGSFVIVQVQHIHAGL